MIGGNSLTIPLHSIQNDLSQLENQLLKFKLIISQASLQSLSVQLELNSKISSQLEMIQTAIGKFCDRYQDQIKHLQDRLNLVAQISNGFAEKKQWSEDQKYFIVTEKISMLQRSLKKTQQNQSKLIETINNLMAKYQIQDQPTLIQNDQYLKSRIKTSQASSLITFQPCSGGNRQVSMDKLSSQREDLKKTMKKNEGSIYLINDRSHPYLHTRNSESPQYLRTFSKQGQVAKISLKQTPGAYNQAKFLNSNSKPTNQSLDFKDSRPTSLDRHEHRFKFMMNNLYY